MENPWVGPQYVSARVAGPERPGTGVEHRRMRDTTKLDVTARLRRGGGRGTRAGGGGCYRLFNLLLNPTRYYIKPSNILNVLYGTDVYVRKIMFMVAPEFGKMFISFIFLYLRIHVKGFQAQKGSIWKTTTTTHISWNFL